MDFIEKIQGLSKKIEREKEHIQTEEATKNAFVLPFISALGYDVFSPLEVSPEFTADVGIKKGEKVDYAIMKDGKPVMLFECKACGSNLEQCHMSQLYRYFSVTDARIGVLTNGIIYRFFSDLEKPNQMDDRPFLEIDMMDVQESLIPELKKLTKSTFDLEEILTTAGELKYTKEIKHILDEQLNDPSEDFVKLLGSKVYSGRMTQSVTEHFTEITKRALKSFLNDQINRRLRSALSEEQPDPEEVSTLEKGSDMPDSTEVTMGDRKSRIETTQEEMEGYYIIKSILREDVDADRIFSRDTLSYFGILLDDNNRKPICRLHFNHAQKYIGLFDGEDRNEERIPIDTLDDIFKYRDRLKLTLSHYK